ncbi:uncharacterized protein VICG_00850 [Vittaforma corneae ATCC 50505]|uniref:Uncharacterized protein n=1 Tax=Vittaforma corneae (strain ATCC 50505) TaxID=993615 RepID=L2GPH7_VITCO|nr:uncharacterized protein VICG_00850 [Vittaforma corneae ATCC 50505]ELA42207.1 hypothetical protein VICG_00850 [Vittaforma corneae ATCC 50505]
MKKIDKTAKLGKIIQVKSGISSFLTPEFVVVQTFGKPLENTILCADKFKIKTVLSSELKKDIVIFSPSTIDVDEDFVSWMRFYTYSGQNVYVYIFDSKKQWYIDEVI